MRSVDGDGARRVPVHQNRESENLGTRSGMKQVIGSQKGETSQEEIPKWRPPRFGRPNHEVDWALGGRELSVFVKIFF